MKKLLLAALIAGAVLPGGTSFADHCITDPPSVPDPNCDFVEGDCGFNTIAQEQTTGGQDTFTGAAYGYVGSTTGGSVTIRCYVAVDGSEVASTPTGSGTGFATTAGQVTYTASDTQDVDLCAEWSRDGGAPTTHCNETTTTQIPPQEVIDLTAIPDFLLCPILAQLGTALGGGIPGVLTIDPDTGDVELLGGGFWDCPPYET